MAMPTDYWRNDQSLNIFRTKPCQRLARDGVCGWRSQCQYSHSLEWPRRQPRRYNYSAELCPNVVVIEGPDAGTERVENNCNAGLRCPWAHSKEEVLFHPHMFKTSLCEEHTNNTGNNQNQRQTRNAKKNLCHRYYCPFAHGSDELRTSPLTAEQREKCLRSMEVFPSDVCCVVCTRHWTVPVNDQKLPLPPGLTLLEARDPTMPWPRSQKGPPLFPGQNLWDVLATIPNQMSLNVQGDAVLEHNKDIFASSMSGRPGRDPRKKVPSPIQKPTEDPFSVPYKSIGDMFYGPPLSELHVHQLTSDSPAFISLACTEGYVGHGPSTKMPPPSQQQIHFDML